jgi:hypothetical protein
MRYRYGPAAIILAFLLCTFSMPCEAAQWQFHDGLNAYPDNPDRVTIYGTIDCQVMMTPLYEGWIEYCETVTGCLPTWCNDYLVIFEWAPNDPNTCGNIDWWKVAVPQGIPADWELAPLADWVDSHVPPEGVCLPSIGDATGTTQEIYLVINLDEYLMHYPVPMLEEYSIVSGYCPDLPGYLIGTTPIEYTPMDPDPFHTTPFTGQLWFDGDVCLLPGGDPSGTDETTWSRIKSIYE